MKKQRHRTLSFALALSLLLSTACIRPSITAEAEEPAPLPGAANRRDGTYYSYLAAHREMPGSGDPLYAVLEREPDGAVRTAVEGKEGWLLSAGGEAVYTVDVPQDGCYQLSLTYCYTLENEQDLLYAFRVDGEYPFLEAENLELKRVWRDKEAIRQDRRGNELIPEQECVQMWQRALAADATGYTGEPFRLMLGRGRHTIAVSALNSSGLVLGGVTLEPVAERPSYGQLLREYEQAGYTQVQGDTFYLVEGERASLKSDRTLYPMSDQANAATSPNDPTRICRNVIGGSAWSEAGMWLSYRVEVEQAGLYCLSVKFRQNTKYGMSVRRNIYVNGAIPCKEFENVAFPYSSKWQQLTLADGAGEPYWVYLQAGENTVTFEVTTAALSGVLLEVDAVSTEMNELYRRVLMVTGRNPDRYRDYYLEREIPDLAERFGELARRLEAQAAGLEEVSGAGSDKSAVLKRVAEQMELFSRDVDEVPDQLSSYRENIAVLSDLLKECQTQPLELDYFILHGEGYDLPSVRGTFWQRFTFSFRRFLATFSGDYQSMADYDGESGDTITVWVNSGRDQAQIIRDMSLKFTEDYGINVNVDIVKGGLVEATLAGNAPDIAIECPRGQPVNLASRDALADLRQFEDFADVAGRFGGDALVPYTYQDGVYALPLTQTYQVLFYRTDILEELDIPVPQTWEDIFAASAELQRRNMCVGLPYTAITAAGAVDMGVGAKDLYPTLLMQYGGSYYQDDLTGTALDSAAALDAFKTWTSFYTQYSFDLSYDLNTRFRTGEMPIAIASFATYGVLSAAAPEIRGHWKMAALPGTPRADGTLDRSGGISGTAMVMTAGAKNKEACWQYMRWFTDTATQIDYGTRLENLLGPSARYATANLAAFDSLNWTAEELRVLKEQREYAREIPELPGSYYTSRGIDNAFRGVVYQHDNERIALEEANETINREIQRKRAELSKG